MKKIIAIIMALVLVVSLAACTGKDPGSAGNTPTGGSSEGGKAEGGAASDEVVTVNFYEHTDNEKVMTALVDAYNAQSTRIKVNLTLIANDDYDDKIKVMLSGGADLDGFWLRGGSAARQLAEQGALLALDDLNAANGVDVSKYGSMIEAFAYNGKNYGLLTSKSCWLLWYNKDLFDAAGMDYPINLTWDQYSDLAKSLTADGKMGAVCPDWMMNQGSVAAGEYLTDESLALTKQYAQHLERWYVTDKSHPSIEDMSGSFDINSYFAEGNTYMMINGDWEFLLLPDVVTDFTWCAAPLPRFEQTPEGSTVGSSSSFSIAANSKHAEEVYDFIKFCCYSDEGAKIYAKYSCVPAYPSDAALGVYKQNVTAAGTEYVFSSKVASEQGIESFYNEINDAFKEELKNSLIGNCTLEEAFDTFTQRRDEVVGK
ncbi:ABC-type glycerol-3-phosphate transport system substrate-binding protein [Anaerotaenia torta]|uniref:ABC transporter substrate-binding protein n=1 Tax=Anaerotaenia torta TaxID=433293 RepID=UPI003D1C1E1B